MLLSAATGRLMVLAIIASFAPPGQAAWLLASDQTATRPGGSVAVSVANLDDDAPVPDTLPARIISGKRKWAITLQAQDSAPPTARRREFSAVLPADITGLVTLELASPASSRLLLQVAEAADRHGPLPRMLGRPAPPAADALLAAPSPALAAHEPMYFLLGFREATTARFQISFKYRMFDDQGPVVEWLPVLSGLRFGYTQTSLWDLQSNSKPFRDTSFRPSLFYQWGQDRPTRDSPAADGSMQAGYEHESNGRDSGNSRSMDTLFLRPSWRWQLSDGQTLALTPKLWAYLDKKDNPDIRQYRGYADLGIRLGRDDGWLWSANARRGTAGFGSLQLDASYPLRRPFLADTGGFLHFQFFSGYGETLLDYNLRRTSQFRIGFSIVR